LEMLIFALLCCYMPARIYFIVQVISFGPKIASLVDHFFVIFAKSCSFK
jgi:hypothetical protein